MDQKKTVRWRDGRQDGLWVCGNKKRRPDGRAPEIKICVHAAVGAVVFFADFFSFAAFLVRFAANSCMTALDFLGVDPITFRNTQ